METDPTQIAIGLLQLKWVTKEELSEILNLNERGVRIWIAEQNTALTSKGSCILSTAGKKGYHIPNPLSKEDIKIAEQAVAELKAKAIAIFEHRKPIEDFLKLNNNNYKQQEFAF